MAVVRKRMGIFISRTSVLGEQVDEIKQELSGKIATTGMGSKAQGHDGSTGGGELSTMAGSGFEGVSGRPDLDAPGVLPAGAISGSGIWMSS